MASKWLFSINNHWVKTCLLTKGTHSITRHRLQNHGRLFHINSFSRMLTPSTQLAILLPSYSPVASQKASKRHKALSSPWIWPDRSHGLRRQAVILIFSALFLTQAASAVASESTCVPSTSCQPHILSVASAYSKNEYFQYTNAMLSETDDSSAWGDEFWRIRQNFTAFTFKTSTAFATTAMILISISPACTIQHWCLLLGRSRTWFFSISYPTKCEKSSPVILQRS